jgi:hypothetical protein
MVMIKENKQGEGARVTKVTIIMDGFSHVKPMGCKTISGKPTIKNWNLRS